MKSSSKESNPDYIKKLMAKVAKLPSIAVGFPAKETGGITYPQQRPDDPPNKRLVEVAIENNYGTSKIPERPFMNIGSHKAIKDTSELRPNVARAILEGKVNIKDGFDSIGAMCAASIQEVIKEYPQKYAETDRQKHNAAWTIARKKGQDQPLTDTGLLAKSVTFETRPKE